MQPMDTPAAKPGSPTALETSPVPRKALEWHPLPTLIFEASLKMHFVNAAARRWFGLQMDEPDVGFTGAESFFGTGISFQPRQPPVAHAFGAECRTLTCYRIPPLANSTLVPTSVKCCIASFLPGEDYFSQQLQVLRSTQAVPAPTAATAGAVWYIVTLLEPLSEASGAASPSADLSVAPYPLFAQNVDARPLPVLAPPLSAKLAQSPAGAEESFFPPLESMAPKPHFLKRSSSTAPSIKSNMTTSSVQSQTPSSIFSGSSGTPSTSASSHAPVAVTAASPIPPAGKVRSPSTETPASRIVAQHRATEALRRRQSSLSQVTEQSSEASTASAPATPLYAPRPPLKRADTSSNSVSSSTGSSPARLYSFSYSSGSSATARNPLSESSSDLPVSAQEGLPHAIAGLTRTLLSCMPVTGLVVMDRDCEHGLVNNAAFDILTGRKSRRRSAQLDHGPDEGVAWSEDGFFVRKRAGSTSTGRASSQHPEESGSPLGSPASDAPGLGKMTLSSILNLFLLREDDPPLSAGSQSSMPAFILSKKPYRIFDAAFATRIIDPLESLLDLVARRGESPTALVGSGELTVGIEVDVEEDAASRDGESYMTTFEQPPPGYSSVQSNVLEHKRVRRRVIHVTAAPLTRADGSHSGGVLLLKNLTEQAASTPEVGVIKKSVGQGHFQQILEHLPHLIWTTTPSGSHDYFNEQWYRYTGLEPETSLGLGWKNPFHPDDMPHTVAAWSRSLATGEPYSVEYRCRRHDGVFRWMLGRANCLRDTSGQIIGWFGSCTDIEEAVMTRQELKRTKKDMEALLLGADLALLNFDRDLRLKSVRGVLGDALFRRYLVQKNFGQRYQDLVAPGAWERFDMGAKTTAILSVESINFEYERDEVKYRATMSPQVETRADGKTDIVGVIVILVDVSSLRQAEEALESVRADHARSLIDEAAAKEASQMKTEFVSTVNHELRTPISAIMGLSELLLDDPKIQSTSRDYVQKIVRSSEALLQMIGSILDISKAEAGKLEFNPRPFALKDVLEEARIFEVVAHQKGLSYHHELSGNVAYDLAVTGDFGRIRQILNNLLSNAIKFTKQGGVSLHVHYDDRGEYIEARFTVADTGMGIKEETLPTLFQAYQQAPGTASRYGGTGLGLYISKKLAEMMDGDVHFTSVYGKGTTAIFTVPLSKSASPPSSNSPATPEGEGMLFDRSKTRVLVAEDNPVNREVAVRFLQKAGYSVESVENGQEVLDRVEKEAFTLLVMDCGMPQMDGYETARRLRASNNPQVRNLKVLALTASAGANDREKCLEAGFNEYLTKPFKGKMLEKTVLDLLSTPTLNDRFSGSSPSGSPMSSSSSLRRTST